MDDTAIHADTHRTEPPSTHLPTICQLLFSMDLGGAEVLAKEIAEAGQDQFRFVFACLDSLGRLGRELQRSGHVVEVLGRKPGVDVRAAQRLAHFCRVQHVNIVHAHLCGVFRYAAFARLLSRNSPILLTDHGSATMFARSWRRVAVNRFLLRRHDRIVAVGKCLVHALVNTEGFPSKQVEVIYNGRDLKEYHASTAERTAARRDLGLAEADFAILQVARLSREKDHATALRTMERLVKRHTRARLLIVGEGPERPNIERQITERGLGHHVTLLGARSDVASILPAADLFLLTSTAEAIPLTIIEAMGAATACVATRAGGVPEIVADNETGLLVSLGDDEALAKSIAQLIEDEPRRLAMGIAGRNRAVSLFDSRAMHDSYFSLYRRMLGTRR